MDNKKLDKLLHEMKNDYDNLPESVDSKTVIQRVFLKRQINWNKFVPTLAAIAGLLIFILVTLGSIDSKQQADEEKEDNGPLMAYFLDRKEAFQQSLGLENVNNLAPVQEARELVDYYEEKNNIEDRKHSIYKLLETPSMKMKTLNESTSSSGSPDSSIIVHNAIAQLKRFQTTFQFLLDKRLSENMSESEKLAIIEHQDKPQYYNFPDAVEEILFAFNKQGYFIALSDDGKLTAKVDYLYLIKNLDLQKSKNSAYEDYLRLLGTEIDSEKPGIGNDYEINWTSFDDVLLSVEEFYNSYKRTDGLYRIFNGPLIKYTTTYLNDYLSAGVDVGETIPGDAQWEWKAFLEEHRESKLWHLVDTAVEQYESNDWIRTDYKVSEDLVSKTLESDRKYGGTYNNPDVTVLPLPDTLLQTYKKYKESKDTDLLKGLPAFKVMQLFMHASDKGDFDTYYSLYETMNGVLADVSKEELREDTAGTGTDFLQLAEKTDYILEDEKQGKKEIIFYFVPTEDAGAEMTTFRVVQNDEGIWKVPYMPLQ